MNNAGFLQELCARLGTLLADGMPQDPIEHARQVAEVAGILHAAFTPEGYEATLVGGAALSTNFIAGGRGGLLEHDCWIV